MALVKDSFIRLCLKPSVECDLPGRLRLRFGRFELLPKAALPYLHYIEDIPVMLIYPFVQKYFVKGIMIGAIKG